jgi:hypothetical protein
MPRPKNEGAEPRREALRDYYKQHYAHALERGCTEKAAAQYAEHFRYQPFDGGEVEEA